MTSRSPHIPKRLQGTDGIRREVRRQSEFPKLAPLDVFLQHHVITDEFLERYAYAFVSLQIKQKQAKAGDSFVVGWDPRDPEGTFTEAVVRGVRKAGANVWVIGAVPTPLVPMYVLSEHAAGGFMVTASHNPREHNGVKIFLGWRGMKLLPENDMALTRAVVQQGSLAKVKTKGRRLDVSKEALALFKKFHLDPNNAWTETVSFNDIVLVVDPARGSLTGIAAEVFREAGFGEVHEVNSQLDGNVNHYSGVADLEGVPEVTAQMIEPGGRFARYPALHKLFELGRKHDSKIKGGDKKVCGAVFDADGDRFYRLDYHPERDSLLVLSGDETAFLQAKFLRQRHPDGYRGARYMHTVESDINCGTAAEQLGLKRDLAPVGDKWILWRIMTLVLDTRLKALVERARRHGTATVRARLKSLNDRWRAFKAKPKLDVHALQQLGEAMDTIDQKLPSTSGKGLAVELFPFAVGSEETGHNITTGWLETEPNVFSSVHCGNGLKSALNTFAATQGLFVDVPVKKYFAALQAPFERGHKATLYTYHIDQSRFANGSTVWRKLKMLLAEEVKQRGWQAKTRAFPEDPEMLYLAVTPKSGRPAAVFVRNSGTENKISVNLRGGRENAKELNALGEAAVRLLMQTMKDPGHPLFSAERKLVGQMAGSHLPEDRIGDGPARQALTALGKQGLAEPSSLGYRLTPRGRWYHGIVAGIDPAGADA